MYKHTWRSSTPFIGQFISSYNRSFDKCECVYILLPLAWHLCILENNIWNVFRILSCTIWAASHYLQVKVLFFFWLTKIRWQKDSAMKTAQRKGQHCVEVYSCMKCSALCKKVWINVNLLIVAGKPLTPTRMTTTAPLTLLIASVEQ